MGLTREKQNALFDYQYQNFDNDFQNFSTTLSLKYAPNDKNIMTPGGKYTYEKKFPQFFINFEKGMETFGGKLDYQRFDALAIHQFRSKLGVTNMKFFGGISSGTAPIWKNFELMGQTSLASNNWDAKINFHSNLGFVPCLLALFMLINSWHFKFRSYYHSDLKP